MILLLFLLLLILAPMVSWKQEGGAKRPTIPQPSERKQSHLELQAICVCSDKTVHHWAARPRALLLSTFMRPLGLLCDPKGPLQRLKMENRENDILGDKQKSLSGSLFWEKYLQGLKSWAWPPKFCRTFGGSAEPCFNRIFTMRHVLQNLPAEPQRFCRILGRAPARLFRHANSSPIFTPFEMGFRGSVHCPL